MTKEKIIISACLAGVNCKYNGQNNYNQKIMNIIKNNDVILICPEQLGGLSTPRNPSEIRGNRVINNCNEDVTDNYNRGAEEVLRLCKELNIKKAILKSRSPSCGKGIIYDGTFSHKKIQGNGITAALLIKNDIEVLTEEDIERED
jgi:uncharacterized protein YbbK (DUF523 family)